MGLTPEGPLNFAALAWKLVKVLPDVGGLIAPTIPTHLLAAVWGSKIVHVLTSAAMRERGELLAEEPDC